MAIEITEKMNVDSSPEAAWRFITDPERVVTCMPGAELVEKINDTTYEGKVKVKLGAITTAYKGEVVFASVDEANHTMVLTGEGRETGGGTAQGSLEVRMTEAEQGVDMAFEIRVDLTGKVMQMGRGMIKGVSGQLFKQFAKAAREQIQAAASTPEGEALPAPIRDESQEALAVGSLVGRTLWQAVVDFFKRLFGGGSR